MKRIGSVITSASFLVLCLLALTGFGCRRQPAPTDTPQRSLIVWGLWQDSTMLAPVLRAFQDQTKITVEYKKIASVADYERTLLEALAQGRGPDVFVIHHTWIENKRGIMSAAPAQIVDERAVREEFVEVVGNDVVRDGLVYALPTSVDTLALFYNKDLLGAAGIARPPQTWQDMLPAVERLTRVTPAGTITQSAIALGTATNINRPADILQVLMLQSGVPIIEKGQTVARLFTDAAERALLFYTNFSNKSKKTYTWDLSQDYSIDAFAEGDTAMMINYSYHIPTLRAKNPRLSFGIAPLPQNADSTPVNFASYWPFTVASNSTSPDAAWQFVRFMTNAEMSKLINDAQHTPPARRDSVTEVQRDPELGAFADATLTAVTWPRGDIAASDRIFNEMIDSVVTGKAVVKDALHRAEDQLNQLTRPTNAPILQQ